MKIPSNLEECFEALNEELVASDIKLIKNSPEGSMHQFHHGIGRWIRNNWGLWSGSTLSEWFNEIEITHADDMSGIILESYWKFLNNKPIGLEDQVKIYHDFWKDSQKNDGNYMVELKDNKVVSIKSVLLPPKSD